MKPLNSSKALFTIMAMLLLSIILLAIWGYHNYFSGSKEHPGKIVVQSDSSANTRNNISSAPAGTTGNSTVNKEVTTALLKEKLGELELLKAEITAILKNNSDSLTRAAGSAPSGAEIDSSNKAPKKTDSVHVDGDIKNILDSLKHQNNKISSESNLLTKTVNKVRKDLNHTATVRKTTINKSAPPAKAPTNTTGETANKAAVRDIVARKSTVVISNLGMFALDRERILTTKARETAHFMVSFSLSSIGISSGELLIKIKRPDGRTIITNDSEYSLKVPFSSQQQRVNFFINTANLPKGLYTIEVYFHSDLIAQSSKTMI